MKSFLGVLIFIFLGLFTALLTGFGSDFSSGGLAYDEEQKGLKEQIIIKFSHVVAENTPKGLAAEKFASLVSEKTHGKVEVQVYPNGILYSDQNEFDALIHGDVQMIAPAFSKVSNLVPAWLALDLPFAFSNQHDVDTALNGEIGTMLFKSLETQNMLGLAYWDNGFKQMTSKAKPLRTPDDFTGQRFRIMPSKVIEDQFHLMNAKTIPISFSEVFQSFQRDDMDGQENTISNIYTKRLYQVQKHLTLSNHGYLGYAVVVNKSFWEKLPPDIQMQLRESMKEATEWANNQAAATNEKQLQLLKETGIQIHELSPIERKLWEERFAPLYQKYTPIIGHELMEKLKHIRKQKG